MRLVNIVIHGVRDDARCFADVEQIAVGGGHQAESEAVWVIDVLHQGVEPQVNVTTPNLKINRSTSDQMTELRELINRVVNVSFSLYSYKAVVLDPSKKMKYILNLLWYDPSSRYSSRMLLTPASYVSYLYKFCGNLQTSGSSSTWILR